MGIALGTVPLAGCSIAEYQGAINRVQNDSTIVVEQEERALFDQAVKSRDVTIANQFLEKYPSSKLVRKLLLSLPPETLKRLSRPIVASVSRQTLDSLPNKIRLLLGLLPKTEQGNQGDPSDGYSG